MDTTRAAWPEQAVVADLPQPQEELNAREAGEAQGGILIGLLIGLQDSGGGSGRALVGEAIDGVRAADLFKKA